MGFVSLRYEASPECWPIFLFGFGLYAAVLAGVTAEQKPQSFVEQVAVVSSLLLCAYVATQTIPLPIAFLRALDPTRAEVADAVGRIAALRFSPLTLDQGKSCLRLSWMVVQALTFLVAREASHRTRKIWFVAVPILLLAAIQALLAVLQHTSSPGAAIGTFGNKNHLAGFLEMALPFALLYGISFLRARETLGVRDAVAACFLFGLAALILVAIIFTLSKFGFLSTAISVFVMGVIAAFSWLSGGRRWLAITGLAASLICLALLLPTNELVSAFGGVSADPTAEGRIPIARDTLHLIAAYPLWGTGLGTYFPAFVRYQNYAPGVAWLSSNSDFLDFASELGGIGFLILATFVCAVLLSALRAACAGPTRQIRLLGLACVGALAAILVHGIGYFDLHVPANGLLFAWIAGIAASLPSGRIESPVGKQRVYGTRACLFVMGTFACLYGAGTLLYLHSFQQDLIAERQFCRFGICDLYRSPALLRAKYGGDLSSVPPEEILVYLERDPAGADWWEHLGESFQKAGRNTEARYSFQRAVVLAPRNPVGLYRAADFYFGLGERERGLALVSTGLQGSPNDAGSAYEDLGIPLGQILDSGLPPDPLAWRSFLRWQMERQRPADAAAVWARMLTRPGYIDTPLASDYVNYLLSQKRIEAAVQAWGTAVPSAGYPHPELVYNGDFESDPVPRAAFDWRLYPPPGALIGIDTENRHSGSRSLELQFDRTQDLTDFGVVEHVYLTPGSYRFRVWVKSKDLSTDQGISLELIDESGNAYFKTEPLLGTTIDAKTDGWKLMERSFRVGETRGGQRIIIRRDPARTFDNKVNGTLWIDQVSIQSAER